MYYLDTGTQIPFTSLTLWDDERQIIAIADLVLNSHAVSGWKGRPRVYKGV